MDNITVKSLVFEFRKLLIFYFRYVIADTLLKMGCSKHPWGTMFSWLLKRSKGGFNNQESIGCCSFNKPPWFCKQFSQPSSSDIEVRVCADEPSSTNEDIQIEVVEIYIQ